MKLISTLAAALLAGSASIALAQQGTAVDGATANEKPGQGTNTGVKKDDKTTAPAPASGANSGASAGSSGDSKGMPPTTPDANKAGSTK